MMYTKEELEQLKSLFDAHHKAEERLHAFCSKVASALGFDTVYTVGMADDDVYFTAEWNGPYQSQDSKNFDFPAKMLPEGVERVVEYFERIRKEDSKEKHRESEEKKLLAVLKEKYPDA